MRDISHQEITDSDELLESDMSISDFRLHTTEPDNISVCLDTRQRADQKFNGNAAEPNNAQIKLYADLNLKENLLKMYYTLTLPRSTELYAYTPTILEQEFIIQMIHEHQKSQHNYEL